MGALAERLKVGPAQAFGHFTAACCSFGEYRADGRTDLVSDTTLEDWALWRGRAGRFAVAFRELCVERREGQRDAIGVVKGWWRQQALLQKQARDAEKRSPPKTPAKPPGNPRGFLGHDNDDVDSQSSTTSARVVPLRGETVTAVEYAQRCTGAANRGLRENQSVGGFNELVASNQLEYTSPWRESGIPADLAAGAILHRAKEYRPKPSYRQPTHLGYFDKSVREAWDRKLSAEASADVIPLQPVEAGPQLSEWEVAAVKLQQEADRAAKRA